MGARRRPSHRAGAAALAGSLAVIGALVACAQPDVDPSSASPFTPVTVDDGGFCEDDPTASASSEAFTGPVTLDREDGGTLDGTATVADVPEGTYPVDLECTDGRISRSNFHVESMPSGADTGIGPDGPNLLQWAAGVFLVAGLAALGFALTRGRSNARRRS